MTWCCQVNKSIEIDRIWDYWPAAGAGRHPAWSTPSSVLECECERLIERQHCKALYYHWRLISHMAVSKDRQRKRDENLMKNMFYWGRATCFQYDHLNCWGHTQPVWHLILFQNLKRLEEDNREEVLSHFMFCSFILVLSCLQSALYKKSFELLSIRHVYNVFHRPGCSNTEVSSYQLDQWLLFLTGWAMTPHTD